MNKIITLFFVLFVLPEFLTRAAVSPPNPFLRPGSLQPPPPKTNSFKPKPVPKKNMAKEIEFRGYFILKGQPHFCIFNKKSKHGEWIALSELTYEEFKAHEFDEETEILTVLYEGDSYELSLLQGGSSVGSPVIPSSSPAPVKPPPVPSENSTLTRSLPPKYMPPRPTKTPALPAWLVNRRNPQISSSSSPLGSSSNTGNYLGSVPRRVVPSLNPSQESFPSNLNSPSNSFSGTTSANLTGDVNNRVTSNVPLMDVENGQNSLSTISQENELDLDSLPPPPPPPNISPPTPPPNILPSREN